jgi:hypothetical protein
LVSCESVTQNVPVRDLSVMTRARMIKMV